MDSQPPQPNYASSYPQDPYLTFQPHYAFSLPVQILLTGIITALAAVLLFQLLFTAPYHWPLAKVNFLLQVTGVCTLLFSLIITLWLVLTSAHQVSSTWPYMLDYIAISLPPSNWSLTARTWWYVMEAAVSGIVQITHIQFLTFLYPSPLEARLIFSLLGPLAIASSGMTFASLSSDPRVVDLGDAIRIICNSALTLIFTASLFAWGILINRKQAWRTDGGTAAFGAGACTLAVISTSVNFIQIPEDGLVWLPYMLWAIVLWQSFLGWWWWVGSGMGVGEVDEILLKQQKRKEARARRRRKKEMRKEHALSRQNDPSGWLWKTRVFLTGNTVTRRAKDKQPDTNPNEDVSRSPSTTSYDQTAIEMSNLQRAPSDSVDGSHVPLTYTDRALVFLNRYWRRLIRAHEEATIEQVELRLRAARENPALDREAGWGLGQFGLQEREEVERRIREADRGRRGLLDREETALPIGGVEIDTSTTSREGTIMERSITMSTVEGQAQEGKDRRKSSDARRRDNGVSSSFWALWWWGPLRRWRLKDTTTYT